MTLLGGNMERRVAALVFRLRVYVDNPDRELVQGMPVTVKLRNE